jgi:uncharacterized phage-associated protein
MQNGPVLSEVLNTMKDRTPSGLWKESIRFVPHEGQGTPSNKCVLKKHLDVEDYLSEFEINLLTAVWEENRHLDKWDLVDLTHEFPEWDKSCAKTKTSSPISLESIFELGLNESPELARKRAEEIEYFESVAA